jgi:hypothetical protein
VRSNAGALDVHPSADELAELAKLAEPADQYWKERSHLSWS